MGTRTRAKAEARGSWETPDKPRGFRQGAVGRIEHGEDRKIWSRPHYFSIFLMDGPPDVVRPRAAPHGCREVREESPESQRRRRFRPMFAKFFILRPCGSGRSRTARGWRSAPG